MIINNVGFDHCHDADFFIDRPDGSGDYLLLLVRTPAVFEVDGKETLTPACTVFIYPKGRPQRYRCVPLNVFENDWVHFDFDDIGEEEELNIDIVETIAVYWALHDDLFGYMEYIDRLDSFKEKALDG